jgi:hypothetical protein
MTNEKNNNGSVHLVGSIAMDNCEEVFTRLSEKLGPYLSRIPDGETGERSRWIYFIREMLMQRDDIEIATSIAELELHQWDGKLLRSLPLLHFKDGAALDKIQFDIGYDKDAANSYEKFCRLRKEGVIPEHLRFQVCLSTPMASGFMYISHKAYAEYFEIYERSLLASLQNIVDTIPHNDLSIQYDVCQEVLLFEDYFPHKPKDYKQLTFDILGRLGDAVPESVELGYHLCYGSPYDEHLVMPKDMGVLVELMNGIVGAINRDISFLHIPVPKKRSDDEYFAPLKSSKVSANTKMYLGLIHYDDEAADQLRIKAASKYLKNFGIATECGWGRSDPAKAPSLLDSHALAAKSLA